MCCLKVSICHIHYFFLNDELYWARYFMQLKCERTALSSLHPFFHPRHFLTFLYNGPLEKCSQATMSSQVWRLNGRTFERGGNSIEWWGGNWIRKRGRTFGVGVKSCKWCGNNNLFFFWRSCSYEKSYSPPPSSFLDFGCTWMRCMHM
jgi:hypothetical protein